MGVLSETTHQTSMRLLLTDDLVMTSKLLLSSHVAMSNGEEYLAYIPSRRFNTMNSDQPDNPDL